jgi:hypothetical protein
MVAAGKVMAVVENNGGGGRSSLQGLEEREQEHSQYPAFSFKSSPCFNILKLSTTVTHIAEGQYVYKNTVGKKMDAKYNINMAAL